jgi:V8-like Glu-specific endopeptidase
VKTLNGLPQILLSPLSQVLKDCDEFGTQSQLYSIFAAQELELWRQGLPEADNLTKRVDLTISYLMNKKKENGEQALIILLRILADRYDPKDERNNRLNSIADQIEMLCSSPSKPKSINPELNLNESQMLWTVDVQRMLRCARSVAMIEVPRFKDGKLNGKSTGTAWLLTPDLALTCRHVIEATEALGPTLDHKDFEAQIANTSLNFDYTAKGRGLQFGISSLEYLPGSPLDYALLRLKDRSDMKLGRIGYLRLDADAPLNEQTTFLYIIQHPLGLPQQSAGDFLAKFSPDSKCILYKIATELGTSGAPVLNRSNWRVVALHLGENENEKLRQGLLIKTILSDLESNRNDLFMEISEAQNKEAEAWF